MKNSIYEELKNQPTLKTIAQFNQNVVDDHELDEEVSAKLDQEIEENQDIPIEMSDEVEQVRAQPTSNRKIKSLQMKSLKSLSEIITSVLGNAGRDIINTKGMMERFQDNVVTAIAEIVFLHKRFVIANHCNIVDLNKQSDNSNVYSYRLAWGITSSIYAKSIDMNHDARGASSLHTSILLGIYGDSSNPAINNIRNKLSLDVISQREIQEINERLEKVTKYNPFKYKFTDEESFYYSVSVGWGQVFNALYSNKSVLIDGNSRAGMRRVFQESVLKLFGAFSNNVEHHNVYMMMLKSCVGKVASFQSNIIKLHMECVSDNSEFSSGHLIENVQETMDALLERLSYCTDICTKELLSAENGKMVEGFNAYDSDIDPVKYFQTIEASIDNYVNSIHAGLHPSDIAQRFMMLQRTSLDAVDFAYEKFRQLTTRSDKKATDGTFEDVCYHPENLYGQLFNSVKVANGLIEVLEEKKHGTTLKAIVGSAVLSLTQRNINPVILNKIGFDADVKYEVVKRIKSTASMLGIPSLDVEFNSLLLSKSIEAIARTRGFSWGIHEGFIAINVVNTILKTALNLYSESPVIDANPKKLLSYQTALDKAVLLFSRVWESTTSETLTQSSGRFCLGEVDFKTAMSIIDEFNKQMEHEGFAFHNNAKIIYESLLNHDAIQIKSNSHVKPLASPNPSP